MVAMENFVWASARWLMKILRSGRRLAVQPLTGRSVQEGLRRTYCQGWYHNGGVGHNSIVINRDSNEER